MTIESDELKLGKIDSQHVGEQVFTMNPLVGAMKSNP